MLRALHFKPDEVGIGSAPNHEIIFERSAADVINQVDSRIYRAVLDPGIGGYVCAPFTAIVADQIIDPSAQWLNSFYFRIVPCASWNCPDHAVGRRRRSGKHRHRAACCHENRQIFPTGQKAYPPAGLAVVLLEVERRLDPRRPGGLGCSNVGRARSGREKRCRAGKKEEEAGSKTSLLLRNLEIVAQTHQCHQMSSKCKCLLPCVLYAVPVA